MCFVISIVGKSNSGKTTLIERLIPIFKEKGFRVGVIKHDAHKFEIDHEGKDSWRMAKAGSDVVVLSSAEKLAMIKKPQREIELQEIVENYLNDVDIVIAEGYKKYSQPKIEVLRQGEPTSFQDPNLVAIVYNSEGEEGMGIPPHLMHLPVFRLRLDDVSEIAKFIMDFMHAK